MLHRLYFTPSSCIESPSRLLSRKQSNQRKTCLVSIRAVYDQLFLPIIMLGHLDHPIIPNIVFVLISIARFYSNSSFFQRLRLPPCIIMVLIFEFVIACLSNGPRILTRLEQIVIHWQHVRCNLIQWNLVKGSIILHKPVGVCSERSFFCAADFQRVKPRLNSSYLSGFSCWLPLWLPAPDPIDFAPR